MSLITHAVILPLALPRLLVPASEEIEVTYLPDVVASDTPSPDSPDQPEPDEPAKRVEVLPKPPELLKQKEPDKKKEEKKKPLDIVQLPDLPMVDQEQFPDEADNDKAKFLAQKNHRAAEDVQAKDRTLEKPPPSDSLTAPKGEPSEAPAPTDVERRVAELQPTPPAPSPQVKPSPSPPSPLRMREPGGEQGELVPMTAAGDTNPTRPGATKPGGPDGPLPIAPSRLGPRDYDQLVGQNQAQAERRAAALADRSGVPGRWDRLMKKQDLMRASLENFVGNVKVGNQSELGTRKHPFAAFITTMHRQIHHYWGDGFLADLDHRQNDTTYPMSLITGIEIAVAADGNLDGMVIIKPSGSLPFDVAAMDAVQSAAPFPKPPEEIKSRDGKVYLTWSFHRDERQCHPNYVDMHILTTPPKLKPVARPAVAKPEPTASGERPRLSRSDFTPGLPNPAAGSPFAGRGGAGVGSGLGALGRAPSGGGEKAGGAAESKAASSPSASSSSSSASSSATTVPEGAREAAERWLAAYQKADVRWLAGASGLPFTAGGKQVADDAPALRRFFQEMLGEGVPRRERVTYYTPAGIRAKKGKLPRGGDEDDMMFAWVELAGEDLVLLLSPTDRGWSVVGIDR